MTGKGLICGGSWLVDRNKVIDRWPEEEAVALIGAQVRQSGGPAMNLAVDLRRLGATFPILGIGTLGDDSDGRYIREICTRYDIDAQGLRTIPDQPTSYTDVLTNRQSGKRTFFHCPGANDALTPDQFACAASGAQFLHLGAPGIHRGMDQTWQGAENGWVHVLRQARKAGLATNMELISLDPQRLATLVRPCLPWLDYLIVNDAEIGSLTGMATVSRGQTDVDAVCAAAQAVLDLGVRTMVAVHFPRGCVAVRPGQEPVRQASVKVPPAAVVCSVGAGDAFAAGLLFHLLQGNPLEDGLLLGHAAAAVCLTSMSTNEAFGTAEECMAQAHAWGWREAF